MLDVVLISIHDRVDEIQGMIMMMMMMMLMMMMMMMIGGHWTDIHTQRDFFPEREGDHILITERVWSKAWSLWGIITFPHKSTFSFVNSVFV